MHFAKEKVENTWILYLVERENKTPIARLKPTIEETKLVFSERYGPGEFFHSVVRDYVYETLYEMEQQTK